MLIFWTASYLDIVETNYRAATVSHFCKDLTFEDACADEQRCDIELTSFQDFAIAYVSGWLERKCVDLMYDDDDDNVIDTEAKKFIKEAFRGVLAVSHFSTFNFVKANVLLHSIHELEKDMEQNTVMYATSVKKARLSYTSFVL